MPITGMLLWYGRIIVSSIEEAALDKQKWPSLIGDE